jgi:hypothetical protein
MGASVSVDLPGLVYGTMETSGNSVAWCVIEMCSPWMDGSVNAKEFRTIPSAAMRAADKEVPQTLEAYNHWRRLRHAEALPNQPGSGKLWLIEMNDWNSYPFEEAREFLRNYGKSSSTDDAHVML